MYEWHHLLRISSHNKVCENSMMGHTSEDCLSRSSQANYCKKKLSKSFSVYCVFATNIWMWKKKPLDLILRIIWLCWTRWTMHMINEMIHHDGVFSEKFSWSLHRKIFTLPPAHPLTHVHVNRTNSQNVRVLCLRAYPSDDPHRSLWISTPFNLIYTSKIV